MTTDHHDLSHILMNSDGEELEGSLEECALRAVVDDDDEDRYAVELENLAAADLVFLIQCYRRVHEDDEG